VSVEFGPLPQDTIHKAIDVVLDLDEAGEALAIEVIGLARQAGTTSFSLAESGGESDAVPRWSYDRQSDCLYVRLRRGRSRTQQERGAIALVAEEGRIAGLRADWA
jgi:uncharacterized protein YuzE